MIMCVVWSCSKPARDQRPYNRILEIHVLKTCQGKTAAIIHMQTDSVLKYSSLDLNGCKPHPSQWLVQPCCRHVNMASNHRIFTSSERMGMLNLGESIVVSGIGFNGYHNLLIG